MSHSSLGELLVKKERWKERLADAISFLLIDTLETRNSQEAEELLK